MLFHESNSVEWWCEVTFIAFLRTTNLLGEWSGNLVPQLRRFECHCGCWFSRLGKVFHSLFTNDDTLVAPIGCRAWHKAGGIVRDLGLGLLPVKGINSPICSSIGSFVRLSLLFLADNGRIPAALHLIDGLILCLFFALRRFNVPNHCFISNII